MQKIKAIATDLDGTLLNSNHQISEENRNALRKMAARGYHIILASGRMTSTITPICDQIDIPCSIISYNGSKALDYIPGQGLRTLYNVDVPLHTVEAVYKVANEGKYFLNIYANDELCAYQCEGDFSNGEIYHTQTKANYIHKYNNINDLPKSNVSKLLIITTIDDRPILYDKLFPEFNLHTKLVRSNPEYLEFIAKDISKASALKDLCRIKNWKSEEVLAFGDAENDFEMLEFAGTGIAAANASEGLKGMFKNISKWTNDEHVIHRELSERFTLA